MRKTTSNMVAVRLQNGVASITLQWAPLTSAAAMTSPSVTTTTTKPLQRLALHSTSTCASQAVAYGKCILATYTDVKKDACAEQFAEFGKCLRTAVCLVGLGCVPVKLTTISDEPQVVAQPVLNYVRYIIPTPT